MYKCWKCHERTTVDPNTMGIQCEKCGSKMFYKERPNVKKTIKAR
ncbi:MAG: DNA-directed RNA polymerase subunit P [Euryarchaeota archaeon]|jgi:DNA-directed RNA polymerase subunit P|nr:DNA-directed RNA polymerase subunit P [Euryarchaeota archaeon]